MGVRRRETWHLGAALAMVTLAACGVAAPPRQRMASPSRTVVRNLHQLAPVSDPIGPLTVALTFDDGPDPRWTPQVLDILDRYHVTATFFVLGQQVQRFPDLANEIVRRGHAIANHTWNHPSLPKLTAGQVDSQIERTDEVIRETVERQPTCVRPPYGDLNHAVTMRIAASGHYPVTWTVDPLDWKRPGAGAIAARVLGATHPGDVVLMHDGGGDRSQTVAALPLIIEGLLNRGDDLASTCRPLDLTPPSATTTTTDPVPTSAPVTTTSVPVAGEPPTPSA